MKFIRAMLFSVVIGFSGSVAAMPIFQMMTQVDPGTTAPNADFIGYFTFDNLANLRDFSDSDFGIAGTGQNISGSAWSIGGMTYDGSQYHLVIECDADQSSACQHRITIVSYDTLGELQSLSGGSFDPAGNNQNISGNAWSIGGLTYDGDQYHLIIECDADQFNACEHRITVISYNTLADLRDLTNGSFEQAGNNQNISGNAWSVGGLAYDGRYHLAIECDPNQASACQHRSTLITYDTLADLRDLSNGSFDPMGDGSDLAGLGGDIWSIAGLEFFDVAPGLAVPAPGTLGLMVVGLAALRHRSKRAVDRKRADC